MKLVAVISGFSIFGLLFTVSGSLAQVNSQDREDEPTIVISGQRTKKEKEYSKVYPKLERKLTGAAEFAPKRGLKEEMLQTLGQPMFMDLGGKPKTGAEFLGDLVCKSSAIVLGYRNGRTAHLTEDESWVYTEYDFVVKDVLKDNPVSPIDNGGTIQVTRSGGLISYSDQVIRVRGPFTVQLKKNKIYLLFLHYVPGANGYSAADFQGDFVQTGNRFAPLSNYGVPRGVNELLDSQTLLNSIKKSVSIGCNETSEGKN